MPRHYYCLPLFKEILMVLDVRMVREGSVKAHEDKLIITNEENRQRTSVERKVATPQGELRD